MLKVLRSDVSRAEIYWMCQAGDARAVLLKDINSFFVLIWAWEKKNQCDGIFCLKIW